MPMRACLVALALVSFTVAACAPRATHRVPPHPRAGIGQPYGHGPPPHAPAHGYRHRHHAGVELHFDRDLDVYVVVDRPGLYWHLGRFLRFRAGHWEASVSIDGPWKVWPDRSVPWGLRKGPGPKHTPPGQAKKRR